MSHALIDHDPIGEVFVPGSQRLAELLHQIRMGLLLIEEIQELVVDGRVVRVPNHTESQPLQDGMVAEIVLDSEALQSSGGELSFFQFTEIASIHQLVDSRLDNLSKKRIDERVIFHHVLPLFMGAEYEEILFCASTASIDAALRPAGSQSRSPHETRKREG
jgi:hypothetical protein